MVREAQRDKLDPGNGPPNCLLVPDAANSQILQWGHASARYFWWSTMETDTRAFVLACTVCARSFKEEQVNSSGTESKILLLCGA